MKDIPYLKQVEAWAKLPPEVLTEVNFESFAKKFDETVETMKSDTERLREKKPTLKLIEAVPLAKYIAERPADPEYLVEKLIYRGAAHLLMGAIKNGKTVWLFTLLRNLALGHPFMGLKTKRAAILYVTEQAPASFQAQLAESGLDKLVDVQFFILDISHLWNQSWEARAAAIRDNVAKLKIDLIIIDTFARLAKIEQVNDLGEMNAALEAILPLTGEGKTIILSWHERKAGGTIFEAATGTAASGGAADMLLRIRRKPDEKLSSRVRLFEMIGRYPTAFEDTTAIELTKDMSDYKSLGTPAAVETRGLEQQVLLVLPSAPPGISEAQIIADVGVQAAASGAKLPTRNPVRNAVSILIAKGLVIRTATGEKNDPFRYYGSEGGQTFDGREKSV